MPIRWRLTLAFGVAMAAVLAGMAVVVYLRVGGALLSATDQALVSQAREAKQRQDGDHRIVDQDLAGGTTLAQVVSLAGRVSRATPPTTSPLVAPRDVRRAAAGATVWRTVELSRPKGHWRVLAVAAPGGSAAIVLAHSLESRDETLHRLLRELLLAGSLALLLVCAGGYGLAAAALRPVEAMRRRAAGVTASSGTRLPVPAARDEIARLASTLNEMLARLEAAFEHERRFVSDASHELRTPLTLLRAELDLALRRTRTAEELEATIRSASEETERLSRLTEDLLLIARADQGALMLRRDELLIGELFERVADRFAARANALGRDVEAVSTELVVEADRERVDQALSGLVDNALRHGAGRVMLFAHRAGDDVELHVRDEGTGMPDDFRARAFDRFSRADDARGRGGTGLGLAIVATIAAAHGGSASADGPDVWLTLPSYSSSLHAPLLSSVSEDSDP
jgi:signal transduction histidine kinase